MNHASTFLIVATAATLFACGKSEDVPQVTPQPPVAEVPQAEPAPEPVTPTVETPQSEAAPAAASAAATPASPAEASVPSASAPDLAHGQKIYRQACAVCHDKGVAGAPKTGDKAAWSPRLAQGMDALYAASLNGKGAMPAKGGNPTLADTDVQAAVDYLVAQSR